MKLGRRHHTLSCFPVIIKLIRMSVLLAKEDHGKKLEIYYVELTEILKHYEAFRFIKLSLSNVVWFAMKSAEWNCMLPV